MDAQQLADLYRQAVAAAEADQATMELPPLVVESMALRLMQGVEGSSRIRCPSCESVELDVLNVSEAPLIVWRCRDCALRFRALR